MVKVFVVTAQKWSVVILMVLIVTFVLMTVIDGAGGNYGDTFNYCDGIVMLVLVILIVM